MVKICCGAAAATVPCGGAENVLHTQRLNGSGRRHCNRSNGFHTAVQKGNGSPSTLSFHLSNMAETNLNMAFSPGHPLSGKRVRRIPPSMKTKRIQIYRKETRIATWNIRSLCMTGKLANIQAKMHRLGIKILGLSEVRWPGTGRHRTENGILYYSGGDDPKHQYGVAILISSELEKSVIDFIPLGDRVMLLRLLTTHRVMNVILAYAPTGDKPDEAVEKL